MASEQFLNVYDGPDAIKNHFDPECQQSLQLTEIPDTLDPSRQDGVGIYAQS
jgi:hypothetical protein